MSFVRFDSYLTKLKIHQFETVEQNQIGCKFFDPQESLPLFASEGLNPCIGITLHGLVTTDENMKRFVIFYHFHGIDGETLSKAEEKNEDKKNLALKYCQSTIAEMMVRLNEFFEDDEGDVIFQGSHLLRCSQFDRSNIQEIVAAQIKQILKSPETLIALNEEYEAIDEDSNVNIAQGYSFEILEEPEALKENGTSDAMHVFLLAERGSLKTIYHKGFEDLKTLLKNKDKRVAEQDSSSSTPLNDISNNRAQVQLTKQRRKALKPLTKTGIIPRSHAATDEFKPHSTNLVNVPQGLSFHTTISLADIVKNFWKADEKPDKKMQIR